MANQASKPMFEYLVHCFSVLESADECRRFLLDLCTESELLEMSRRLKAAKMLSDGIVYSEIATQTGLSTATISRVNHCLKYGTEGYLKIIERIKLEEKKILK